MALPATSKVATLKTYKSVLDSHVLPVFSNTLLTVINRLTIKKFLMQKLNDCYSPSTVNHIKCALAGVLNLAVDDELLPFNPAHKLGNVFGKRKLDSEIRISQKINVLTREEISLLLQTFQRYFPKHYPLALTLARTGVRLGEALGIKWGDIDFNGRFLTIQRSYSKGRLETPKSGKSRRVDMSMQLTETLWMLKHNRIREFSEYMPEWVFINESGTPIDGDNWWKRVFYPALDKAELRHIRIHDLRHTYASLLLQAGDSMVYVRDQLGHYSIKVTIDIYGHLVPGGNKEAVDRLDDTSEIAAIRTLSATTNKKDLSTFA